LCSDLGYLAQVPISSSEHSVLCSRLTQRVSDLQQRALEGLFGTRTIAGAWAVAAREGLEQVVEDLHVCDATVAAPGAARDAKRHRRKLRWKRIFLRRNEDGAYRRRRTGTLTLVLARLDELEGGAINQVDGGLQVTTLALPPAAPRLPPLHSPVDAHSSPNTAITGRVRAPLAFAQRIALEPPRAERTRLAHVNAVISVLWEMIVLLFASAIRALLYATHSLQQLLLFLNAFVLAASDQMSPPS
jgi:hypothetical protein